MCKMQKFILWNFKYGKGPFNNLWKHSKLHFLLGEDSFESQSSQDDNEVEDYDNEIVIETMLKDFFPSHDCLGENDMHNSLPNDVPIDDARKFLRLFDDFQKPLYEGSNSSRLSAIVNLLHIKNLGRWSNESFTMLLQLLKSLLPQDSTLPDCYYDAKRTIKDLGLLYDKIDACVNDCMLFSKDDAQLEHCKICNAPRWKQSKHSGETKTKKNDKRIPHKVL